MLAEYVGKGDNLIKDGRSKRHEILGTETRIEAAAPCLPRSAFERDQVKVVYGPSRRNEASAAVIEERLLDTLTFVS
ncbi:hypothetical protein HYQ46_012627 [Verticillium longisporum]|nr:hypothetical protein HYQ46_012627 [Verticillium longisporum]